MPRVEFKAHCVDRGEVESNLVAFGATLLEREPATSILGQFSLSDISRYFPEYPGELADRLS